MKNKNILFCALSLFSGVAFAESTAFTPEQEQRIEEFAKKNFLKAQCVQASIYRVLLSNKSFSDEEKTGVSIAVDKIENSFDCSLAKDSIDQYWSLVRAETRFKTSEQLLKDAIQELEKEDESFVESHNKPYADLALELGLTEEEVICKEYASIVGYNETFEKDLTERSANNGVVLK